MKIKPEIFRAYDIRGKYPEELNEEAVYKIGQAFVDFTKSKKVLVARDIRTSSESLCSQLIEGICSQGAEVIDAGLCSVPCFSFATIFSGADGGIMVTASHLGKEFNGLKMTLKNNIPLTSEQLRDLKEDVIGKEYKILSKEKKIERKDPTHAYIDSIRSFIETNFKPLKIIIDSGNGMAGLYVDKIFTGDGLKPNFLFKELDGNFPNRDPNPKLPASREKLIEKVLREKADLGVMFDGDADRVYFLDRRGEVIDPNLVSALLAQYLIKQTGKKKVLIEVRTSEVVKDYVKELGGKVEVGPTWTIPIKLRMIQDPQIVFGSETSGHYVFSNFHKTDDGILAVLIFLQAISVSERGLDDIIDEFKKNYFIIEEANFKIENLSQAKKILETLEVRYKNQGGEIIKIDGLTVKFKDWWFNLRSSETEPFLRLNLEANSKELMENKKEEISSLLRVLKQSSN